MKKKLFYWIPTVLLLFVMVGSAVSYLLDIPTAKANFELLGYPGYSMFINAAAKFLGAIAIVFPVAHVLKEWAYAGYFFILVMATQALSIMMPDMAATMAIFFALWILSYWQFKAQKR